MRFFAIMATFVALILFILYLFSANEMDTGEQLYSRYCATCHGDNLEGGMAKSLFDGIWQFGAGDQQIIQHIKVGIEQRGMPAFGLQLNDKQITQVLDFIKFEEAEAPPAKHSDEPIVQTLDYRLRLETWAENLEVPWAIAFVSDKLALVTERPGRLRQVRDGRLLPSAVKGIPPVLAEGQGGLLDVAIDPEYDKTGWIYLAYSHALESNPELAMTRIVRGKIKDDQWTNQQVIYQAEDRFYSNTRHHYGSRIVFDKVGHLYFSVGDRGNRSKAQDTGWPNGKIHRINRDGSIPGDNPFINVSGALPTVFTLGNRNAQGLAVHPRTAQIWEVEHGPMGGDELNLIRAGVNFGWPVVTYGLNYDGTVISTLTKKPGLELPVLYWRPSIAVCDIDFYTGDLFPRWKNDLMVAALKYEEVRILDLEENRILHEEVILKDYGRVRDVTTGPDGAIYVVLNEPGRILRLTPVD